jgi:hypothetical protein
MIQSHLDPAIYLLTLLKQNGVYNFIQLNGRKFKNETERFAVRDALIENGSIVKVLGAIGQTYRLTETGEEYYFELCCKKIIEQLLKADGFRKVSDILSELSIQDKDEKLSSAIESQLYKDGLVFATENDGVWLKDKDIASVWNNYKLRAQQTFTYQHHDNSINAGGDITGNAITGAKDSSFNNSFNDNTITIKEEEKNKNWFSKHIWELIIAVVGGVIVVIIAKNWLAG